MNRILAALDASERAPGVFDAAAEIAQKFGAALYLARVITVPPEFPPAAAASVADPLPEHLGQVAAAELMLLWQRAPALSPTAPLVAIGQPSKVILEIAREADADLIVIGSHGYKGWDRLLGTTAASIVNHADRNVLVVHARSAGAQALASGTGPRSA